MSTAWGTYSTGDPGDGVGRSGAAHNDQAGYASNNQGLDLISQRPKPIPPPRRSVPPPPRSLDWKPASALNVDVNDRPWETALRDRPYDPTEGSSDEQRYNYLAPAEEPSYKNGAYNSNGYRTSQLTDTADETIALSYEYQHRSVVDGEPWGQRQQQDYRASRGIDPMASAPMRRSSYTQDNPRVDLQLPQPRRRASFNKENSNAPFTSVGSLVPLIATIFALGLAIAGFVLQSNFHTDAGDSGYLGGTVCVPMALNNTTPRSVNVTHPSFSNHTAYYRLIRYDATANATMPDAGPAAHSTTCTSSSTDFSQLTFANCESNAPAGAATTICKLRVTSTFIDIIAVVATFVALVLIVASGFIDADAIATIASSVGAAAALFLLTCVAQLIAIKFLNDGIDGAAAMVFGAAFYCSVVAVICAIVASVVGFVLR